MNSDNNNVFTRRLSVITLMENGTLAGQTTDTLTYSVYPNAIHQHQWQPLDEALHISTKT